MTMRLTVVWMLSVLTSVAIFLFYQYRNPKTNFVVVDAMSISKEYIEKISNVTPEEMGDPKKLALTQEKTQKFLTQMDREISNLANLCNCVVLNKAAVLGMPTNMQFPDYTPIIKEKLASYLE